VHVSEISWTKRIAARPDVLASPGSGRRVLNVNKEEQKIALGIRQTEGILGRRPDATRSRPRDRQGPQPHLLRRVIELEEGIDVWSTCPTCPGRGRSTHPSEVLKKGDEVSAVVLEVDADNQRISLGLKQAQEGSVDDDGGLR